MDNKNFEMPSATIILFDNEDVITASNEMPLDPASAIELDS